MTAPDDRFTIPAGSIVRLGRREAKHLPGRHDQSTHGRGGRGRRGGGLKAPTSAVFDSAARAKAHAWLSTGGTTVNPKAKPQDTPAAQAKANVAAKLADRLNNPAVWEAFRTNQGPLLSPRGDVQPWAVTAFDDYTAEERHARLAEEVAGRVNQWAVTSGDNNFEAINMLRAIAEEFGTGGVHTATELTVPAEADDGFEDDDFDEDLEPDYVAKLAESAYAKSGPFYRAVARAMYEQTQDELEAAGITEVGAYRGMRGRESWTYELGVQDTSRTGTAKAANSWTVDRTQALNFALFSDTEPGRVATATFPASRILASPLTGFGCLDEYEVVVLPGPGELTVYRGSYDEPIPE